MRTSKVARILRILAFSACGGVVDENEVGQVCVTETIRGHDILTLSAFVKYALRFNLGYALGVLYSEYRVGVRN